jgi:hypothetical protein
MRVNRGKLQTPILLMLYKSFKVPSGYLFQSTLTYAFQKGEESLETVKSTMQGPRPAVPPLLVQKITIYMLFAGQVQEPELAPHRCKRLILL